MTNPRLGSSLGDFLEEEGIREEVEAHAIKHVLAWQIRQGTVSHSEPSGESLGAIVAASPLFSNADGESERDSSASSD